MHMTAANTNYAYEELQSREAVEAHDAVTQARHGFERALKLAEKAGWSTANRVKAAEILAIARTMDV